MADTIRIKGGNGDVPTLQDREIAYRKDEKALYIGTGAGNIRLCGADDKKNSDDEIQGLNKRVAALESKQASANSILENINAEIAAMKSEIATSLATINARLDALEHPSE